MADNVSPDSGILGKIGRNITVMGSIVAAVVGMNTALTTCSAQTIARHQTFEQAVNSEEQYWRSLYADYLASFGKDVGPEEKEARLYALKVLADRQIPDFKEYSLGYFGNDEGAKALARDRLTSMKSRLQEALSRKESSTPAVAAAQQARTFESAVQNVRTAVERQADQSTPATAFSPTASSDTVSYQTQILAAGNPKGWDFDVFWCGGGDSNVEAANYRGGLAAARFLADLSASNKDLGGEQLGRVRLVMLPEQLQGGALPARGYANEVRPDAGAAERQLTANVLKVIPGGGSYRVSVNPPPPSANYLSLFNCSAGTAPVGRPPPTR